MLLACALLLGCSGGVIEDPLPEGGRGGSGGSGATSASSGQGGAGQGGAGQGGATSSTGQGGAGQGGAGQGGATSSTGQGGATTGAGGDPGPACGDAVCNAGETCASCPADCGACPPPLEARFNFPAGDTADTSLEDTVVDLINHAAPGSSIHVSMYHFTRKAPADALVAARMNKNVSVHVVLDGSNQGNQVHALLSPVLGPDLTLCQSSGGGSCLGKDINHSKFYLFSALDDGTTNVVVQSSANLTNPMLTDHNNLVIVRGDAQLYQGYLQYWGDQKADQQNLDYYKTIDGSLPVRAYFFPRAQGDTILSVLDNVVCSSGNKKLRIAMSLFMDSRVEVAQKIAQKKQQGCSVVLVLADRDGSPGAGVLGALDAGNVTYHLVTPTPTRSTIHSKYLLIDADYQTGAGAVPKKLVFTGSHNYTGGALRDNDEQLVRLDDPGMYSAFLQNWQAIRDTVP